MKRECVVTEWKKVAGVVTPKDEMGNKLTPPHKTPDPDGMESIRRRRIATKNTPDSWKATQVSFIPKPG